MMKDLPELTKTLELANSLSGSQARVQELARIDHKGVSYPLMGFSFGNPDPKAPVFGIVGGVHGLERIGAEVAITYLSHLVERLSWDKTLRWQLEKIRIFFVPLVNPVGTRLRTRSNGNGVDLNRNSPVRAEGKVIFLGGGHKISPILPWYMGNSEKMETEAVALCDYVRRQCFQAKTSIVFDIHSGFGTEDQIWFPYARDKKPSFPQMPEITAFKNLFENESPNHIYRFEPQSLHYTTHGDLWDYLHDEWSKQSDPTQVFIPLTLEIGSWKWVKKNPIQLFSYLGPFNPVKPHRKRRALRAHLSLFDFAIRALVSPDRWAALQPDERAKIHKEALELWYL